MFSTSWLKAPLAPSFSLVAATLLLAVVVALGLLLLL